MKIISYEHSSPISWKFLMFCFVQMLRILKYHHLVFARTGIIPGNTLFLLIKHSFSSFRGNFEKALVLKITGAWRFTLWWSLWTWQSKVSLQTTIDTSETVKTSSVGVTVCQFIYRQVMIKQDPPTPIKKTQS